MSSLPMIRIDSENELNRQLTQPSEADIAFAGRLRGDTMVLGAGFLDLMNSVTSARGSVMFAL